MDSVSTFDAKNKLSALLERVERGEEIVITRRGRAVAKLVPATGNGDKETVRSAIRELKKLSRELKLTPVDPAAWKTMRDEGRR